MEITYGDWLTRRSSTVATTRKRTRTLSDDILLVEKS